MSTTIKRITKTTGLLLAASLLTACFSIIEEAPEAPQTNQRLDIKGLDLTPVQINVEPAQQADLASLKVSYESILSRIEDPKVRQQLQARLADIEMALAEQAQQSGTDTELAEKHYSSAISAYQSLLSTKTDDGVDADILYQLSRAFDLKGESQQSIDALERLLSTYPDHPQRLESWFRIGESRFSAGQYQSAIAAYLNVVNDPAPAGEYNPFKVISAYMMGWSHFKLEQQAPALEAFTVMLDNALPVDAQDDFSETVEQLPTGEKRLVTDTLRIMALLFSYLGNADAIESFYAKHGERHYVELIYAELAQQHLNNDRFRDSAETYLAFAQHYPVHQQSIGFFIRHIDAYILGDFPSLVLPAKQRFVETYGVNGPHWQEIKQPQTMEYLKPYLKELAQFNHSLAQRLSKQDTNDLSADAINKLSASRVSAYKQAARWYREYLQTFTVDPADVMMRFYLAESLDEAGEYLDAIGEYSQFAFENPQHERAADAAYSAILSFAPLMADNAQQSQLQIQRRELQTQFVYTFAGDGRAISVARQLMQQDFESNDFEGAGKWAAWLIAQTDLDSEIVLSARLTQAHSVFALNDFSASEQHYRQLILWIENQAPAEASRIPALTEKMAASMFRQAEQSIADGNMQRAVAVLNDIITQAPLTDIRRIAQYDAATYLLGLKDYASAVALLLDFERRFSGDALIQEIPEKLLFAYEQQQDWPAAADILHLRWSSNPDSEQGREALFTAASYYKKAGLRDKALPNFRTYAHRYPDPFNDVTEARFIMSEFYRESGEDNKRRFWLKKLILGHENADAQATDRSRYLAAMSSIVFADDAGYNFKRIPLSMPLNKSLKKKQQAMKRAISEYDKVMAYGIEAYSTAAHFKLGQLYQRLAQDLMNSSRPGNLSALELEQYELLLEEQAFPFEERAIELHLSNSQRSWQGVYNRWVKDSFDALAEMSPGRYAKQEQYEELDINE